MSMLVWVMMGIAIWHFTVFVPDRFWGGIVGAFVVAIARRGRLRLHRRRATVPGENDTDLAQALIAVPGALIALGSRGSTARAWRREHVAQPAARHGAAAIPSGSGSTIGPRCPTAPAQLEL